MDRPGHEERKRTPGGEPRERPVPCICGDPTFNIVPKCDDCHDRAVVA